MPRKEWQRRCQSCRHQRGNNMKFRNGQVVLGKKYHSLTVLSKSDRPHKNRGYYFECKCDCGNIKTIRGDSIGRTTSCGCLLVVSAVQKGQKYNKLTTILQTTKGKRAAWECSCDCGNTVVVSGSALLSGNTQSCGCLKKLLRLPNQQTAVNRLIRNYKRHAIERGHAWELSKDEFRFITKSNCYYCGIAPFAIAKERDYESSHYVYNGIDRRNNKEGYKIGNVVPCCKICNRMKMDLPEDEFYEHITRIKNHLVSQ
jgi:hypothetical protein